MKNPQSNSQKPERLEPRWPATLALLAVGGLRLALPSGKGKGAYLPLVVTIEDNGDGIPESIRPHLFDAFISGKQSGTGLGLAIVAKIVADHGGLIEVESPPKKTIFRVFLPMAQGRPK